MAIGGVFMRDTDGNIGAQKTTSNEKVSGLLFDVSGQSGIWSSGKGSELRSKLEGTVVEVNSMDDVKELGLTPFKDGEAANDLLFGVPYYHIKHFFDVQGENGRLFIMFADCTSNWDAVETMQRAAHGMISQLGVWTDKMLWRDNDDEQPYTLNIITDLNNKAKALAEENSPLSILLCANTAMVSHDEDDLKEVDLDRIPTVIGKNRYVSVLLGQAFDPIVTKMQVKNKKCVTPVGTLGVALGCLAIASVQESIAWVNKFDISGYFPDIEMGFGNAAESHEKLTSSLRYSSLNKIQLDAFDDKGYIILCKYAGKENGVFFSKDQTCSDGDYRTIARNRTINKSRRAVRSALLPYVNSPLKVDPSTGNLSAAKITMFQNIVSDVLSTMQTNEEISGFQVKIDPGQNVLKTDILAIKYSLVPVGVATRIDVVEGLALTNK